MDIITIYHCYSKLDGEERERGQEVFRFYVCLTAPPNNLSKLAKLCMDKPQYKYQNISQLNMNISMPENHYI